MPQEQAVSRSKKKSYLYDVILANNNSGFLSYMPDELWRTTQFDFGDAIGSNEDSKEVSYSELWAKLKPVIWRGRCASHFAMFMEGCRDLLNLDFDFIETEAQWIEFSEKMQAANQRKDWYDVVLRQKANIDKTLVVGRADPTKIETDFFLPLYNMGDFLSGFDTGVLASLEKKYNMSVSSLEDYEQLLHKAFEYAKKSGVVALKDMQAYKRYMDYNQVSKHDARKAFDCVSHNGWAMKSIHGQDITNFQNYIMHLICDYAAEFDLPVQIHSGSPAPTDQSNPLQLINLIEMHPGTRIIILHCGGSYFAQFAMTAKYAGNVYYDLAWLLTGFPGPTGTRRLLDEWLEIIPWDKFTWGADCAIVEETYGTFIMAKRILSQVLSDKVEEGFISLSLAEQIAKMIFRDNAVDLYRL